MTDDPELDAFEQRIKDRDKAERNGQAPEPPQEPAPDYKPFPLLSLPEPLKAFVTEAAAALKCDACYVALPVLAAVAGAIGNTRTIRIKHGWQEPAIVWTAVVGDSGTVKSPAWYKAIRPLHIRQGIAVAEYRTEYDIFMDKLDKWEKEKKKKQPNPSMKPGKKPVLKHILVSDTTIEKLAEILEDCPRGTFLARDELGAWLTNFSRYKGRSGGSDLYHWLEAFHGRPWKIDRKTGNRTTLYIERATVSLTGALTPGVLCRVMTDEFMDAGLAARLLLAMPPKVTKEWTDLCVDPDIEKAYDGLIGKLLDLEMVPDNDGNLVPLAIPFSDDGYRAWKQFFNEWAKVQAGAEGELAAAFSKHEAYAARLALLHHVVKTAQLASPPPFQTIDADSVQAGAVLAWWFGLETQRIYGLFHESKTEGRMRRLVEYIRSRGGEITVKELHMSNTRKYKTSAAARADLEELVTAGLAQWFTKMPGPRGGRPSEAVRLLTAHNNTYETSDMDEDEDEADNETPNADNETPSNSAENEVS